MEAHEEAGQLHARMVAIDLLRGVAILWVVLFHLWGDIEYFPGVPREYYDQLAYQFQAARGPWAITTASVDLILRKGFQGVPLFMMISGLSLTIAAYRAGDGLRWPAFMTARFRKLLIPYIVGVVFTYVLISLIAMRQAAINDASFTAMFTNGVTISEKTIIHIDAGVWFASFTLIPRLLQDQWFFAPQLALWFVGLLAQYYLLFPFLLVAMRKLGVPVFLLVTLAVTVGANAWAVHEYGALELKFFLVTGWAPFRLFEFTVGMALGWLLIDPRAQTTRLRLRHPVVLAAAIAAGLAAMIAGDLLIGWWTADQIIARDLRLYWQALALPLVTIGLALLSLPLLLRSPSPARAAIPVRALVAIGIMSYALLIVSDMMRLVASQLMVEGIDGFWWAAFLVAYVPLCIAIAWPLNRALGLTPRARPAAAISADSHPMPAPAHALAGRSSAAAPVESAP